MATEADIGNLNAQLDSCRRVMRRVVRRVLRRVVATAKHWISFFWHLVWARMLSEVRVVLLRLQLWSLYWGEALPL